ncbi:hypothetical protein DYB28_003590, partial [Aphanomyces astaci]
DAFRVELADHRPAVVKQTCGLLGALAWACGASFTCIVEALLVPILLMATKKKQTKVIATAARHCLDCMAKASRFAIVILERTYHHAKQDDALRMMCLSLVELVLRHGDVDNVMSREVYIPLRQLILKSLRDHNVAAGMHCRPTACNGHRLLELAMAEYPESLLAATGRQPEEVATEASMLSVIPEGDDGDVDNSWDDLSTVLIGDSSPPQSGDQLDWSVSTIEDEDNGENWREPAMAAVSNKLDDSWDDLSTVLITELSPPQSGDQLDWSVSMIEVEAHDDGADDGWREPAAVVVATQLDNSWDDLALSSTSSVIDVPTLDSTRGRSILNSIDGLSSIIDNVMATETRRQARSILRWSNLYRQHWRLQALQHTAFRCPSFVIGVNDAVPASSLQDAPTKVQVGAHCDQSAGKSGQQLEALTKTVVEWTAAMNVPKHQVQLPFEESHKVSWDTAMEDLRRQLELEPMVRHGS